MSGRPLLLSRGFHTFDEIKDLNPEGFSRDLKGPNRQTVTRGNLSVSIAGHDSKSQKSFPLLFPLIRFGDEEEATAALPKSETETPLLFFL
ncbi:hypothetical protein CEXT_51521 [Caerostris extrusa]|uniref:Uncharacterized protein n=1 Tax=Caerostris extrusa TaxID=172846 RepID=A0AAV4N6C6_CAEEX|nr:hypothetical protein CEXT_51521 [Caerostris extrusa]